MKIQKYLSKLQEQNNVLQDVSIIEKIILWFEKNPYPLDSQLHEFAKSLGLEADVLETYIYAIVSCFISGGNFNAKKADASKFDPEEIKMGLIVEAEHIDKNNTNPVIQKICNFFQHRITFDHLADNDKYYSQAKAGKLKIEELAK
jgi:hypothetical protein